MEVVKNRYKNTFFLNGKVYRLLRTDKMNNLADAFDYEANEIRTFIWSDLKRKKRPAWCRKDLTEIFNKHWRTIQIVVYQMQEDGMKVGTFIEYESVTTPSKRTLEVFGRRGRWAFSDEDVINIWRTKAESTRLGRLEYDDPITARRRNVHNEITRVGNSWPTLAEVEARIGLRELQYIRTPEGEFVPTWRSDF